jgi:hypothetical protein
MNDAQMVAKILELKDSAARLDQKIVDPKTKEFFLRPPLNGLRDVELYLLPNARKPAPHSDMWQYAADFMLQQSEAQLKHAEKMVSLYGTSLQLIF